MPKMQQLLDDLQGEQDYGIFLAAQMGGVPNELQLILQTAQFDEAVGGLRPRRQYVVRALGVEEHRVSLGVFGRLFVADEHPLLYHYNLPRMSVNFEGKAKDVNELVLDIHQAYVTTFGPWRELASDINRTQPLVNLLSSGSGMLGRMPQPAAERMAKVLAHHSLIANLDEAPLNQDEDKHGRSPKMKMLGIDDSYFIALAFSVEEMGKI
jgi:hypothetical protein